MALKAGATPVAFEPDHLRRVLVNLLDNALRYAGNQADSIRVHTSRTGNQTVLSVWSDGAPLEQTVQRHLFEPFFSSESRSSGLGLYICRELCEQHGALIGYRRGPAATGAPRDGNEFFVSFRPAAAAPPGTPRFDTIA
ncbi:MAG: ATP-binding protein [Comamonadaceae bacterium]|nr:MAG: ATP-binding protein [Comamonadaceae bacterium]